MYVKLREINDREGEGWNFYIHIEGNEKAIKTLQDKIRQFGLTDRYILDTKPLTDTFVDTKCRTSMKGYLKYENKVEGRLDERSITKCSTPQALVQLLYVGGIQRISKNE